MMICYLVVNVDFSFKMNLKRRRYFIIVSVIENMFVQTISMAKHSTEIFGL